MVDNYKNNIEQSKEKIGFEHLIAQGVPILIDNSVLGTLRRESTQNNRSKSGSLDKELYKGRRVNPFPTILIQRARIYADRIYNYTKESELMLTAPEILQEYNHLIKNYDRALKFVNRRYNETGSVAQEMRKLIDSSRRLYDLLELRCDSRNECELNCIDELAQRIQSNKLHFSQDGRYRKRMSEVDGHTDFADAQLVASAAICALKTADRQAIVVSGDMDVANIVRNTQGRLNAVKIDAYMPDFDTPLSELSFLKVRPLYAHRNFRNRR